MSDENRTRSNNLYKFDDVTVDCENFRVQKHGKDIALTPRAFDVLIFFLQNGGRIIEKQELFERVWKNTFVSDNALTKIIKEIRHALDDDANNPRVVETVPKRGYRFIAETEEETIHGEAKTKADLAPAQTDAFVSINKSSTSRSLSLKTVAVFGIIATVLLTGFIVWRSRQEQTEAVKFLKPSQITNWTSLDIYPAFSPDGNSVAYSSDHNGSFEIYVKPLAPGANEIQLTSDGQQNFQPAFSPDGKFIAYYSKNRGGIWTIHATGGKIKQLTSFGSRPAWSPDGSLIAFQSHPIVDLGAQSTPALPPSTIWIVPSNGATEPTVITQVGNPSGGHGAPVWSPDGKRIVFCASDVASSIWTISGKGGQANQVVNRGFDPIYAPDGESIYYVAFSGLWKIRVSPASGESVGEPVQLTGSSSERIRHIAVTADGRKIAYAALLINSNIRSLPLAPVLYEPTGTPGPLTQDRNFRNSLPVFSPDGKRIAFNTQNVNREDGEGDIWVIDADGKNAVQITTEGGGHASWFPDGEQIAFLSGRQDRWSAWTTNLKTGQEKPLLDFGEDVRGMKMSPNGKQIVYNSKKSGTINMFLIPVEGGEARQLTFDKESAGFAYWSPDGKMLAFSLKRGDDTYIAVMPGDGGEITQLTFDRGQSWVGDFSPDGDKIVFAGFRNGVWNLYWISLSTKQQKQLTNYTKLNSYVRYPTWSPLGNQIAFEYAETTGNIWIADLK